MLVFGGVVLVDARVAMSVIGVPCEDAVSLLVEPAQGTALYALQSCANHSCCPVAMPFKGEEEADGAAVLVALCDIAAGDEVRCERPHVRVDLSYQPCTGDHFVH